MRNLILIFPLVTLLGAPLVAQIGTKGAPDASGNMQTKEDDEPVAKATAATAEDKASQPPATLPSSPGAITDCP